MKSSVRLSGDLCRVALTMVMSVKCGWPCGAVQLKVMSYIMD